MSWTRRSRLFPTQTSRGLHWDEPSYVSPKVLLVDEDFARQDDARRMEMLGDIPLKLMKNCTSAVLYVTNDYQEAVSLNKKVVFMKDGKITDIR